MELCIEKELPLMREGVKKIKNGKKELHYSLSADETMEKAEGCVIEMKKIMEKAREAGKLGRENCENLDGYKEDFLTCASVLNEFYMGYDDL